MILAVGTRLQDFTTGSWTAFSLDAKFISLNAGRHDAGKHMSLPIVGDAKISLNLLSDNLEYAAPKNWVELAQTKEQMGINMLRKMFLLEINPTPMPRPLV